jgi:hypothetical protein
LWFTHQALATRCADFVQAGSTTARDFSTGIVEHLAESLWTTGLCA